MDQVTTNAGGRRGRVTVWGGGVARPAAGAAEGGAVGAPAARAMYQLTANAAVRPVMIMICWMVVIRPRMLAGATSEIYAGERTLAAPTAMPPIRRAMR